MSKVVSKISAKTLKAAPKMILVEVDGKQVPRADGEQALFRVVGRAMGFKVGNSEYGQWVAFTGDFRATVFATGEMFQSSKVFLPDSVTGVLQAALANSNAGADFAFDIGVEPATTPTGYSYTIKSLIAQTPESDPLAALLAQVNAVAPLQLTQSTQPAPELAQVNDVAPVESKKSAKK